MPVAGLDRTPQTTVLHGLSLQGTKYLDLDSAEKFSSLKSSSTSTNVGGTAKPAEQCVIQRRNTSGLSSKLLHGHRPHIHLPSSFQTLAFPLWNEDIWHTFSSLGLLSRQIHFSLGSIWIPLEQKLQKLQMDLDACSNKEPWKAHPWPLVPLGHQWEGCALAGPFMLNQQHSHVWEAPVQMETLY